MNHTMHIAAAGLLLALALGCEDQGLFDRRLDFGAPVELSSGIAVLEQTTGRVFLLEVSATGAAARLLFEAGEGTDISWLRAGPSGTAADTLFLLTVPASERDTGAGETLVRVAAASGAAEAFPVGTFFDGAAFAPDGRFLVLYHGAGSGSGSLYNPNEIALVDLDTGPGAGNPLVLSVQLGGRAIEDVRFVPSLEVDGQERRLVAFLARGLVKLVDLLEPQAGTVSVKLAPENDTSSILAQQILARPGDAERDPMLFVRASGTNDIYAVSLIPREDGQPGLWATLNMFDGGSPRDMALVEDGGRPLLVVASQNKAVVIDVDTADSFSLTLDGAAHKALLRGVDGAREVVLYGTGTYRIHFLAVEGLAAAKGGNLSGLTIPDGVDLALPLAGDRLLLTTYGGDLILLDLPTRVMTRLAAAGYLDWSSAAIHGDVFFFADEGSDRVLTLDLATGHPEPLVLDESVQSFHMFAGSAMGLVVHPCPTGRATLFPLAEPTRDRAFMVDGFWLDGFLDETEVQP
jgi:hypothetical protein